MSGIIYTLSAAMCFVLFKKFPPQHGSSSELDIAKSGSVNQLDEDSRVLLDRSSSEVVGEEHHEDEPWFIVVIFRYKKIIKKIWKKR